MKLSASLLSVAAVMLILFPLAAKLSAEQSKAEEKQVTELENQYLKYRDRLLKRYDPLVASITQVETGYVSALTPRPASAQAATTNAQPTELSLWWGGKAKQRINDNLSGLDENINSLFTKAIHYSSQIRVFSDLPLIRNTSIQEAEGPFDFRLFADGSLADIDEPVGDELRTGGPLRYEEQSKGIEYGVRKKFITGTEVEINQRIGDMNTNSIYFNPEDQARTGTHLIIRQPLLKGFGIAYQESPIQLAIIDHAISESELQRQVESHLLEVARAYWGLYLERALFLQKKRLAEKTGDILKQMEGRSSVDVTPSLLARARSLVKAHDLGALQAEYAMRNAQSRIISLINDPSLITGNGVELITSQQPLSTRPENDFSEIVHTALLNRPEIAQGIRQIQAADIRQARSKNELRPNLDFVFDTYVKGLDGDFNYSGAYSDQFDEGSPSYLVGLHFEYPLGNNSAEARNLRKRIETRQLLSQLDVNVEHVLLEVQVTHREMMKYYESMLASHQIMLSDQQEIKEILETIDYNLSQGQPYGDMLYRLMDASERLTESEEIVARSEMIYNLSLYSLYRAMGILVSHSDIGFTLEEGDDDLPVIKLKTFAELSEKQTK
jgi:outer membrane protein TolC